MRVRFSSRIINFPFMALNLVCAVFSAQASFAQRPVLQTFDAAALGAGTVRISAGADYARKSGSFPDDEMSRLLRLCALDLRVGVARNVDVTAGWRGRLIAESEDGTSYSDWGDPTLSTKVVLTDSGALRPALALLSEVKLPSTRHLPHRLGSDATDFYFRVLLSHHLDRFILHVNAGFGIIGDPRAPGSQDDIFTGSVAFMVRPAEAVHLFTELYGFTGARENDEKLQIAAGVSAGLGEGEITFSARRKVSGTAFDFSTGFDASELWGIALGYSHRFDL